LDAVHPLIEVGKPFIDSRDRSSTLTSRSST
jgi:hypothetical protein